MEPEVLAFYLRTKSERPIYEYSKIVGIALGCVFKLGPEDGTYHGVYYTAQIFNLDIALHEKIGASGDPCIALDGSVDDAAFYQDDAGTYISVRTHLISVAIQHALEVRRAGKWWLPSAEEIIGEVKVLNAS